MTTPLNSVEKSQAFSGRPSLDDLARELGRARAAHERRPDDRRAELWYWRALAAYREAERDDLAARNRHLNLRLKSALGELRRRCRQVETFGEALRASRPRRRAARHAEAADLFQREAVQ